jgi:putative NADPH-quinone reductase
MKVIVIVAHPNKSSFNHAIAKTCIKALSENCHEVIVHDLYEEQFNPVLPYHEFTRDVPLPSDVQRHCDDISGADGIVIVHPNWWGQPPGILKGWIDRVIRQGVAYEFVEGDKGEGVPRGLLKAQSAIIFNTSNTEAEREKALFGDPLELIWKNCVFDLCGVPIFHRRMFNIIVTSTAAQREQWLEEVQATIDKYYPKASHNQPKKVYV